MQRRKILQYIPIALAITASPRQLLDIARRAKGMAFVPGSDRDKLLVAMVDVILPATATPSASEAGVPAFIELTMAELVSRENREEFYAQLDQFGAQCLTQQGLRFDKMTPSAQHEYFGASIGRRDEFCRQLKQLTMTAYYTSQRGMTEALEYNPIPGTYNPCMQVNEDTKTEASYF